MSARTMNYDEPVVKHGGLKELKAAFARAVPAAKVHPWKGKPRRVAESGRKEKGK